MPSGPFAHVCLLVNDLDKAVADWTAILGVLDPGQLDERLVRYDEFDAGDGQIRWATFVASHGAEIQLTQPAPESALGRRLAKHGEHVHHICFTVDDPAAAAEELRRASIEILGDELNSDPNMPWQRWTWVSPKSAHGVLVEVARPYRAVNGKWESAAP